MNHHPLQTGVELTKKNYIATPNKRHKMKNLYLPVILSVFLLSACKKNSIVNALSGDTNNDYTQTYSIMYYAQGDSFTAGAKFAIEYLPAALSSKESVTFNGQPQDQTIENYYIWKGKGKIDADFVFKKKSGTLTNRISLSKFPDFKIVCPDTLYKTKPFVVRVPNYIPKPGYNNVGIETARRSVGNGFKGDSVLFNTQGLKEFAAGKARVTFHEKFSEDLQNSDNGKGGTIEHWIEVGKDIWIAE